MKPFHEDGSTLAFDGLTIENRCDRISVHGSMDIRRDLDSLPQAIALSHAFSSIAERLAQDAEAGLLPDVLEDAPAETVANPFAAGVAPTEEDPPYPTEITVCEGKYTVIYDFTTGRSECLRYGEPWRQLTGDKMVLALFDEIVSLRRQLAHRNRQGGRDGT